MATEKWVMSWAYIFNALSRGLDAVDEQAREFSEILNDKSDIYKKRRLSHDLKGVEWAFHYERPALWMLFTLARIVPLAELIQILNPQNLALWLAQMHERRLEASSHEPPLHSLPRIVGFAYAIRAQQRAHVLFNRSMSALIAEGAKGGNDQAFFDAIRVDPVAVACKATQKRLQQAVAINDEEFLKGFKNAIVDPLVAEQAYSRLDAALYMLMMAKQIDQLTQKNAAILFIEKTRFYPGHGIDAERSLWRKIQRWKKDHATLIRGKMSS